MPKHDTGPVLQIASLAVAITSVIIAFLAFQTNRYIAITSGVLERPTATLGIAGTRINRSEKTSILFGTDNPSEGDTIAIGAIPFGLANEGTKTVDNPTMIVRLHKLFQYDLLAAVMKINTSGDGSTVDLKVLVTSDDSFDYASYQAKTLHPGVRLTVHHPFFVKETVAHITEPFVAKDGNAGTATLSVPYALQFLVTTIARDIVTANYFIDVAFVRSSSVEDMLPAAVRSIEAERRAFRKRLNSLQYLSGLVFRSEERKIFLIYGGPGKKFARDGKVVLGPDRDPKIGRIDYNLLSWWHLFGS
jgi:hypothetical protein